MSSSAFGAPQNNLSFHVVLNDATGIATTVTTGGTFFVLKGTAFAAATENNGAQFTWDKTTGLLTAAAGAAGKYLVIASVSDCVGNNSATVQARLEKNGAIVGNKLQKIEGAAAARSNLGVSTAVVDVASGDVLRLAVTSGTNADVVTIRDASILVLRIGFT